MPTTQRVPRTARSDRDMVWLRPPRSLCCVCASHVAPLSRPRVLDGPMGSAQGLVCCMGMWLRLLCVLLSCCSNVLNLGVYLPVGLGPDVGGSLKTHNSPITPAVGMLLVNDFYNLRGAFATVFPVVVE